MPWVKLKVIKQITRMGVAKVYRPGESVEVGRQTAVKWILANEAEDAFSAVELSIKEDFKGDLGLRVVAKKDSINVGAIRPLREGLKIHWGRPKLVDDYTCIWWPTYPLGSKPEILNYGFMRVIQDESEDASWEMAAMLLSLDKNAGDFGSEEEKAKTKAVIGDLRMPMYDARIVWVRKTPATERVIDYWAKELEGGADINHSFLRALYSQGAMLCTLPANWGK